MSAITTDVQVRHVAREERIAELEATLRDIAMGADMMLEPALAASGAFAAYAREVKRVALAELQRT